MPKLGQHIKYFMQWVCLLSISALFASTSASAEDYSLQFPSLLAGGSSNRPHIEIIPSSAPNGRGNVGTWPSNQIQGEDRRIIAAERWLRFPISFEANKRPLAEVLREFASRQGVASKVSPLLDGTLSGTFSFDNPAEFLDVLCRVKQMNWYFDGATVYFFGNSEIETRLFPLKGKNEDTLLRTLRELGFFDSRFEWRSADGGRLLMVQGPEVYLSRVGEILERIDEAEKVERAELAEQMERAELAEQAEQTRQAEIPHEKTLGVFRLKYAWAAEKNVVTGDTTTTVPGVADILRQIVSGSPLPSSAMPTSEPPAGAPRLIKGTGVIGRANASAQSSVETTDDVPFIQADMRINAVLVWDYAENLARYRDIVAALDHPLELVEIRAAIIDVETDRTRELGFTWEYRGDNSDWQNNAGVNVGDSATRPYIPVTGNGFQYATIYTHGLDSFMARVNLMEKNGDANILSRPTVLTQDNIQAVLEHTDTFYVRLQGQEEVDLADITTGLTLKVTPHVIPGDDTTDGGKTVEGIQMAVHIVNGSNTAETSAAQVDDLPRVKQSTITTQAVVREGEALVIGGYYNETRTVSRTGVPGLSKIPGIGALFRNKSNIASKSERLFVLSPRIVRLGELPLAPGTEGERLMEHSPSLERLSVPAIDVRSFSDKKR